mmetsp:Transcript_75075/g.150914  ORF Transcript_75075/g.150914 Transcript_75075/m.150914 type:complete len:315 (+) Transcript_75075:37-981(+)|eukprot:CAMPEP_0171976830 /NCGR_PEP_ID=MMETSP0993-20121228/244071_1 /TAXON_ID=483369 /ORGANISM="non described non described, Strain CCMP2098" /LENGTH=314 /DNA_ID=CAMNT_0012628449 /DNA_START=73 /DNA_END=1017 /DNA_ORIENTATION=+
MLHSKLRWLQVVNTPRRRVGNCGHNYQPFLSLSTGTPLLTPKSDVTPGRFAYTAAELVRLAKRGDTHLRALEDRIESAEAHRAVLWQRLQSGRLSDERDHETTAEAYRRNTSDLLAMYREHKAKADSMLFTVLALFGGSVATLFGSAFSHWRSKWEHELLGERLEAQLQATVISAVGAALDRHHSTERQMQQLQSSEREARSNDDKNLELADAAGATSVGASESAKRQPLPDKNVAVALLRTNAADSAKQKILRSESGPKDSVSTKTDSGEARPPVQASIWRITANRLRQNDHAVQVMGAAVCAAVVALIWVGR